MTVNPLNGVALLKSHWYLQVHYHSPYLFSSFLSPLSQEQDPPYSFFPLFLFGFFFKYLIVVHDFKWGRRWWKLAWCFVTTSWRGVGAADPVPDLLKDPPCLLFLSLSHLSQLLLNPASLSWSCSAPVSPSSTVLRFSFSLARISSVFSVALV